MSSLAPLLIFAGIALLNFLLKKSSAKLKDFAERAEQFQRQQPARPLQQPASRGSETDAEEERMRRFFEALGLPPGSSPPPGLPRTMQREAMPRAPRGQPARKIAEVSAEQLHRPPPQVSPPRPSAPPPPLTPEILHPQNEASTRPVDEAAEAVAASARATEKFPEAATAAPVSTSRGNLLAILRSPSAARNAILLREILGPPRALTSGEWI